MEETVNLPPKHNTLMALLAYLGPLVFVSYIVAKDDSFVKFHIGQGLVLLVLEFLLYVLGMILFVLAPIVMLAQLAILVLIVIGIYNVTQGNEKKLPLVGEYSKYFPLA